MRNTRKIVYILLASLVILGLLGALILLLMGDTQGAKTLALAMGSIGIIGALHSASGYRDYDRVCQQQAQQDEALDQAVQAQQAAQGISSAANRYIQEIVSQWGTPDEIIDIPFSDQSDCPILIYPDAWIVQGQRLMKREIRDVTFNTDHLDRGGYRLDITMDSDTVAPHIYQDLGYDFAQARNITVQLRTDLKL